jgi:hypothetical protein
MVAAAALLVLATPAPAMVVSDPPPVVAPSPVPSAPPFRGQGFAIGDSVMLGAKRCLEQLRWTVDTLGSRQVDAGAAALRAQRSTLPRVVVVHLGTNGGIVREQFDRIMRILGRQRTVVWATIQLPETTRYSYEDSSNRVIRAGARRWSNARLADWNALSYPKRSAWMWSDGIHLTPTGCTAFARIVDRVARA